MESRDTDCKWIKYFMIMATYHIENYLSRANLVVLPLFVFAILLQCNVQATFFRMVYDLVCDDDAIILSRSSFH